MSISDEDLEYSVTVILANEAMKKTIQKTSKANNCEKQKEMLPRKRRILEKKQIGISFFFSRKSF